jgi:AraC-like DNA-binding protein
MKWITREKPKIDRIACPWLILRFIDPQAEIVYVPADQVKKTAADVGGIPFDVQDVEYTHYGDRCTFDFFVEKHQINDRAVHTIGTIVRGADTDRFDLAIQSAGLWAISAGLSHNFPDSYEMLQRGMIIYDALYSWARYHQNDRHSAEPFEKLLLQVFNKFMTRQLGRKRVPAWATKLKETIQDQMDTNYSLNLKKMAKVVDLHPDYISREFSKYFDSMSFGEYIRTLRVDKAKELLRTGQYTQSQVAYLTGFSDQSHFIRIFKKHTGMTPTVFKKVIIDKPNSRVRKRS